MKNTIFFQFFKQEFIIVASLLRAAHIWTLGPKQESKIIQDKLQEGRKLHKPLTLLEEYTSREIQKLIILGAEAMIESIALL